MDIIKHTGGIALTVLSAVVVEEFKAWSPRLAEWMLHRAARNLAPKDQERYSEEWRAHLSETPGYLGKVFFAAGLFPASSRMAKQLHQSSSSQAESSSPKLIQVPQSKISIAGRAAPDRKRILVVDDEQVIANTLAIILNMAGYSAQAAYSGEQAVALAPEFKPEAVISDVIMTGMTGIEAGIQIRSLVPSCQVILFAGQIATRDMIARAARAGHHFGVLSKPAHPTDIIARLRSMSFEDRQSN